MVSAKLFASARASYRLVGCGGFCLPFGRPQATPVSPFKNFVATLVEDQLSHLLEAAAESELGKEFVKLSKKQGESA